MQQETFKSIGYKDFTKSFQKKIKHGMKKILAMLCYQCSKISSQEY